MKSIFCFSLAFCYFCSFSQNGVPFAKMEWCKAAAVEIISGDVFPENHVVIGTGNFLKVSGVDSIEKLSPKLIKSMRRLAAAQHCCKVFVDFKELVASSYDGEGHSLQETHVSYFTIQPLYYPVNYPKPETNE